MSVFKGLCCCCSSFKFCEMTCTVAVVSAIISVLDTFP